MHNPIWNDPVLIGDDLIFSARQAEKFLNNPQLRSDRIQIARAAIAAALDGRVPPDEARREFVAAVGLLES